MKLRVEVTAEDIANGVPKEACGCPVALALTRCGLENVAVGNEIMACWRGLDFDRLTPETVERFIDAFDDGRPVEPFSFDFDIPEAP